MAKKSVLTCLFCCLFSEAFSQKDKNEIVFLCTPCGMDCDTIVHPKGGICSHCNMRLLASFPEMRGKSGRGHFQHIRGKKMAVLIFPGVEIIDFAPEFEIFGQAGVRVFTVAPRDTVVRTAMGLRILPDFHFANAPDADILLLPGGHVEHEDTTILDWVKKANHAAKTTLTVCNGAFFLASAGLLDGLEATTFNGALQELQAVAPRARVVNDRRFVDNGKIVTSAGLASGIDAAFHVLSEFEGVGRAQEVATFLEYNWDSEGHFVRAQLADRHVRPLDDALAPFMFRTEKYAGDRDRWTLEVLVTEEFISIEKIAQLLEFQWKSDSGWSLEKKSGLDSHWILKEKNGQQWQGSMQFERREGGFLARIFVEKMP